MTTHQDWPWSSPVIWDSTVNKESETLRRSVLSIHCWLIFTSQVFHTLSFWGLLQHISVFVCTRAWASTQAWAGNRFTLLHGFFGKGYINRIRALSPGPLWLSLKEIIHHDSGWLLSLQGIKTAGSIGGIRSKGTPKAPPTTDFLRYIDVCSCAWEVCLHRSQQQNWPEECVLCSPACVGIGT